MLLTITSTAPPATDLGYLLHKHPERVHVADLAFGKAHVFYPEASEARCTAALLLEVDPVGLARGERGGDAPLQPYVNDRPYVASSYLSVAIAQVLGTALGGRCEQRPELVARPLPLVARLPALPARGGEALLQRLFAPLGYQVQITGRPLDRRFPGWGASACHDVELRAIRPLVELLTHLYVLVPVLDDDKHYWVGDDEVDKLLRRGRAGWRPIRSASSSPVATSSTSGGWRTGRWSSCSRTRAAPTPIGRASGGPPRRTRSSAG